jgi:hypothetical protein
MHQHLRLYHKILFVVVKYYNTIFKLSIYNKTPPQLLGRSRRTVFTQSANPDRLQEYGRWVRSVEAPQTS